MMGIVTGILELGSKVIDKIFPDKEKAAKAKLKLMELQQQGELKELETSMSAILAEAKSSDPWTSRARPAFMYVFYIILLFSIPMGILSGFNPELAATITSGIGNYMKALPEALWWLFGTGYTGYVAGRSFDKKKILEMLK